MRLVLVPSVSFTAGYRILKSGRVESRCAPAGWLLYHGNEMINDLFVGETYLATDLYLGRSRLGIGP
jgi:hypothetical protein